MVAHCGMGGHRGQETTLQIVKKKYFWTTMDEDVISFCQSCLHCLSTLGGSRIPRPMGHVLHSDKPNGIIHFDYSYMDSGTDDLKYVFIIKDDATKYTWLTATESCDTAPAVQALLDWFAAFGYVQFGLQMEGLISRTSSWKRSNGHYTAIIILRYHTICREMELLNGYVEKFSDTLVHSFLNSE